MPQIYARGHDLQKITTLYGRLCFVAELIHHSHDEASGADSAIESQDIRECVSLHRALLTQWLRSSLEDRIEDLQVHFNSQGDQKQLLADPFAAAPGSLRFLLPASVSATEEKLFVSDVRLLSMILQGSPNPDNSEARGRDSLSDWRVRVLKARAAPYGINTRATLKTLGGDLRISTRHLGRVFRRTTGVAFHHYVKSTRLAKAADLLRSPTLSIKEISAIVGYTSSSNFTRDFTSIVGVSPKRYRDMFIDVTAGPQMHSLAVMPTNR